MQADRTINFGSLLAGVVGVVLAIFFYVRGQRERQPFFGIQPTRSIIVNRDRSIGDKLSVSFRGRAIDGENITALQCAFWNAGREPIRGSDILLPLRIVLPSGAKLLDATVVKETRPSIVRFHISEPSSNFATLDFNILEKNDGAVIQLIYVGDPSAEVILDGTIVEAQIKRLEKPSGIAAWFRGDNSSRTWNLAFTLGGPFALYLVLLPGMIVVIGLFFKVFRKKQLDFVDFVDIYKEMLRDRVFLFIAIVCFVSGLLSLYFNFIRYPDIPSGLF